MDLGIKGRKAVVCAASKGLGRGCAEHLAEAGCDLVINARSSEALERTAEEITGKYGVTVTPVASDVTTEEGRSAILEAMPEPDILINNAGGPPPGEFRQFSSDDWRKAVEWNMITPLALIHATIYGMADRGFGRIVNITSYSVKQPIPSIELSNGARAGLTGAVASLARTMGKDGVTINALLPGKHDTDRLNGNLAKQAERRGISVEEVVTEAKQNIPVKRFGTADEFGATCAFLCSMHAGYINGQNIVLDGGEIVATL